MSNYITQYQLTPEAAHNLESVTWFFKAEVLVIKHCVALNLTNCSALKYMEYDYIEIILVN